MKKVFLSITASLLTLTSFAQWTTNGNNVTIDKNIGIGTTMPSTKLDVNGDAKVNALHLRSTNPGGSWLNSNIYYPGHSLVIGSPEGNYSHNYLDLKPGGSPHGMVSSGITMWVAHAIGNYEKKVQIQTVGNTYFNGGNVGIGTESPTVKLDVNGDIKANMLHLRSVNPGSSYVYSHIYYPGHSLVIGSPQGNWSINNIELKPGGSKSGAIYSTLSLFTSPNEGVHERKILFHTQGNSFFNGGNVGIGTDNPQKLLDVKGTIHAQNIEVNLNGWSDFVFDKDYKLPTLLEVEAHINEHNRLPDIPSEKQVKEEGINIGEMQAKLLQKIEELTLYVIDQNKKIEEQHQQIEALKSIISVK